MGFTKVLILVPVLTFVCNVIESLVYKHVQTNLSNIQPRTSRSLDSILIQTEAPSSQSEQSKKNRDVKISSLRMEEINILIYLASVYLHFGPQFV